MDSTAVPAAPAPHPPSPLSPAGQPPLMAWRLGYAGLLPFVLGTLLVWMVTHAEAHAFTAQALAAYAALIVSFLGGIHWGLAMRHATGEARAVDSALVWGVMPSLLAWMAVLMPPYAGLVLLGMALIACYLVDRRRYEAAGLGAWLTLRFRLTAVASLSCFLGAAGT